MMTERTSLKYKVDNSNGPIKMEEKVGAKCRTGKSLNLVGSLLLTYGMEEEGPEFGKWMA